MHLPICRWAAAVVLVLACLSARVTLAGVVVPPASDPLVSTDAPPALPAFEGVAAPLAVGAEPQPFWYPGADDAAIADVSLSAVPVPAQDGAGVILPGTQQHPLIPLPPSAWTGMAGLLGLGAVKLLRNARRLLA